MEAGWKEILNNLFYKTIYTMDITLVQLENALKKSRNTDTCYFKSLKDRRHDNPCIGHCTVTALVVQDYF